jgi:site-specific recombinase XerD
VARLSAVPDQLALDAADVPDDWPDLRASFLLSLRATRRSPRTVQGYAGSCDQFARFLAERSPGRLVECTTRDDLRAFMVALEDRGNAPNTLATRHRGLRALFKFLTSEEIIAIDPMRAIPAPSITEERIPPALTAEQIAAMVKVCSRSMFTGIRDRALILLISSSGVRAAEAIGLAERDLMLDNEQPFVIVRGKGDRFREAACSHEAALAVRAYLRARRKRPTAHRPELWLSRTGGGMTTSGLRQVVRDAADRAGLDERVTTHSLRHTATHAMLERGMSEHNVATQLGHKSLKMLARYGRARATERSRDDFFRSQER